MVEVDTERLYATIDAAVWAEEFAKVCPDVDQGLMLGWFANAIETAKRLDDEDLTPDPDTWPECSECGVTFVLRRCFGLDGRWEWALATRLQAPGGESTGGGSGNVKRPYTLSEHLEELERTNPEVREAAKALDRALWRLNFRSRINERRRAEGKEPLGGV